MTYNPEETYQGGAIAQYKRAFAKARLGTKRLMKGYKMLGIPIPDELKNFAERLTYIQDN